MHPDEAHELSLKNHRPLAARACRPGGGKGVAAEPQSRRLESALQLNRKPTHRYCGAIRKNNGGKICRHCKKVAVNRPRGLCWGCYYKPGVRELYPSTSKYARHGMGNHSGPAPLPPEPTDAAPGTPEKIAVMHARAKAGFAIFHPRDRQRPLDDAPGVDLRPADPVCYEEVA